MTFRSHKVAAILFGALVGVLLHGCSVSRCRASSSASLRMPIEIEADHDGAPHRVQGIYEDAFELSSKLAVFCPPEFRDLCHPTSAFNPMDYCVQFRTKSCENAILAATDTSKSANGFWHYGMVDVIVKYEGVQPGMGCPLGLVTILQIIQAGAIRFPVKE